MPRVHVHVAGAQHRDRAPDARRGAREDEDLALGARERPVASHPLPRVLVDERPDDGAELARVTDRHGSRRVEEAIHELVVDGTEHDQAGRGGALLPGVAERARDYRRHRLIEVGVGVDDHRVLPPISGDDALHAARGDGWRRARRSRACGYHGNPPGGQRQNRPFEMAIPAIEANTVSGGGYQPQEEGEEADAVRHRGAEVGGRDSRQGRAEGDHNVGLRGIRRGRVA